MDRVTFRATLLLKLFDREGWKSTHEETVKAAEKIVFGEPRPTPELNPAFVGNYNGQGFV